MKERHVSESNEKLLVRYQRAEADAFDLFYRRNKKLLFNFLKMKLGNQADAEEAFQETFIRIHKYILKYDPTQSAMNWVFTIARNSAIDVIAKNSRQNILRQKSTEVFDVESRSTVNFAIEAKQTLEKIFATLSEDERDLIRARFMDDESYEEIAVRLDVKPTGVRQRVSRLIRKIKTSAG